MLKVLPIHNIHVFFIFVHKNPGSSASVSTEDTFLPPSLRIQSEAELSGRNGKENFVEYEFREYKGAFNSYAQNILGTMTDSTDIARCIKFPWRIGTAHGFASRPSLEFPDIKEAYEAAFEQAVNWFKKTLIQSEG